MKIGKNHRLTRLKRVVNYGIKNFAYNGHLRDR